MGTTSTKLLDVAGQPFGYLNCKKKCPTCVNVSEYLTRVLPNVKMEGQIDTLIASSFALDKQWDTVRRYTLAEQKGYYMKKVSKSVNGFDAALCASLLGGGFLVCGGDSSYVTDQSDKIIACFK